MTVYSLPIQNIYFNPLPRKRENVDNQNEARKKLISIHSLVRGRTILTQSFWSLAADFNPLPRKRENKSLGGHNTVKGISIHSLVRGRTQSELDDTNKAAISIHSLVRGRTLAASGIQPLNKFQSTPS